MFNRNKAPEYWTEKIYIQISHELISYKEKNNISFADLAAYLGVSKARLHQLTEIDLTDLSINELFELCLKLNIIPVIKFETLNNN